MGENESVDIIASGYEFECPACETLNKIIQTATAVKCGACGQAFEVGEIEQAIGGGIETGVTGERDGQAALRNCDEFLRDLAVVEHPIVDTDKVIELLGEVQGVLK